MRNFFKIILHSNKFPLNEGGNNSRILGSASFKNKERNKQPTKSFMVHYVSYNLNVSVVQKIAQAPTRMGDSCFFVVFNELLI